jgi:STE24 endopeptidase
MLGGSQTASPGLRVPLVWPLIVLLLVGFGSAGVAAQAPRQLAPVPETAADSGPPSLEELGEDEGIPVAVPTPSEKALRYYRTGMWLWAGNQLWDILLPALFAFTGLSARLRDGCQRIGRRWFASLVLFLLAYLTVVFLVNFPLAFYQGFVRQHAYGLSNQTFSKWFTDRILGLGIGMGVACALGWVPYLLLERSPRLWWLITTLLSIPFLLFAIMIKPIWVDPLFNRFGPMQDKQLEASILKLAGRAGIEGGRVFEVNKSVDTKAVNAYVTGIGSTKRIVLWDTLLHKLNEREVLFVMAHEMGHYVMGHVVRSIVLSSLLILAALYLVDRLGRALVARFSKPLGFSSLADIASLPLLLMLLGCCELALSPVALAYSRYQETEADRFALELTGLKRSGALAFVKLQEENLSNPRPGPLYRMFRATHPSIAERIERCNEFRRPDPKASGSWTPGAEATSQLLPATFLTR